MKMLLSSCAAAAVIALSAPAFAQDINIIKGPNTISISLGIGLGTVRAETYGSKAKASTTNTYKSSAKATVTYPVKEEEEVHTVENGNGHLTGATEAHAEVKNKSSTSAKGWASAEAGGLAVSAGWAALWLQPRGVSIVSTEEENSMIEVPFFSFQRSAAIAGGLSWSNSSTYKHGEASSTGTGDATADATNDSTGKSSESSAWGGGTATASASGPNSGAESSAGGISGGISATY